MNWLVFMPIFLSRLSGERPFLGRLDVTISLVINVPLRILTSDTIDLLTLKRSFFWIPNLKYRKNFQ